MILISIEISTTLCIHLMMVSRIENFQNDSGWALFGVDALLLKELIIAGKGW